MGLFIKVDSSDTNIFEVLKVKWDFEENLEGCKVDLDVKFIFNHFVYNKFAVKGWENTSSRILKSFEDRCQKIYK